MVQFVYSLSGAENASFFFILIHYLSENNVLTQSGTTALMGTELQWVGRGEIVKQEVKTAREEVFNFILLTCCSCEKVFPVILKQLFILKLHTLMEKIDNATDIIDSNSIHVMNKTSGSS